MKSFILSSYYLKKRYRFLRWYIFFFSFFITKSILALPFLDTNYFHFYTNDIMVRSFASTDIFFIKQVNANNKTVIYKPNQNLKAGLGISYKWIVLSIGMTIADLTDQNIYGKSTNSGIELAAFFGKHYANINYQSYTGFYIDNYEELGLRISKLGKIPNIPNLKLNLFTADYVHFFNGKKFSNASYLNGNTIMKKNSGSLTLSASFAYYNLKNDSNFTPNLNRFRNEEQIKSLTSYSPYISVGYGYNFILFKNWSYILIPQIGLGLEYQEYTDRTNLSSNLKNLSVKLDGFTGLMYNQDKYFISLTSRGRFFSHNLNNISFETFASSIQLNFGFRFKLKKPIHWIGNKIGL